MGHFKINDSHFAFYTATLNRNSIKNYLLQLRLQSFLLRGALFKLQLKAFSVFCHTIVMLDLSAYVLHPIIYLQLYMLLYGSLDQCNNI